MNESVELIYEMKKTGIVPVVVLEHAEDAVRTADAMLQGGVNFMEITLRTEAAMDSIREVSQSCKSMHVGAGTVLTLDQCREAVENGAAFIVSPGYSEDIVAYCLNHQIPVIPGCVTPSEITKAYRQGLRVIKFFPANIYGGIPAMKALSGPFREMSFLPTGGVNGETIGAYVKEAFIHAVGGSWLCSRQDINEHRFDRITELCRAARNVILESETIQK